MVVGKIKQLENNNVVFYDQVGNTLDTFLPATQWNLNPTGSDVNTTNRNAFPFIVRPAAPIVLEYKDGTQVNFTGNARQLYEKFFEPGGFFFVASGGGDTGFQYVKGYQTFFEAQIQYSAKQLDAGLLVSYPVYIREDVTIDKVRFGVEIAAAGAVVYGLYNSDPDTGLPADLLFQTGPFDTSLPGTSTQTLPDTIDLPKGMYWVTYNTNSGAFCPSTAVAGILCAAKVDAGFNQVNSYYYKVRPYTGTLPSSWGAGGAFSFSATINFILFNTI